MRIRKRDAIIVEVIAAVLILVFTYTAISKFLDQQTFRAVISQSSLIGESASVLSWVLPVFELITSLLLFIPASRLVGLLLSFVLMILFTGYVAYNLLYVSNLPCSCGGVVSSLSWNQHLVMNIFLTVLSIVGIIIHTDHKLFIAINRASRTPV